MSTVKKHERVEIPKFKVGVLANQIRKEMALLILRDFGLKQGKYTANFPKLDTEDSETLEEILSKYGIEQDIKLNYPAFFLDSERERMLDMSAQLVKEVFIANSIYPNCKAEAEERRIRMDRAIGLCFVMLQELSFCADVLGIKLEKYERYIRLINQEIQMIKSWRSDNNKFL